MATTALLILDGFGIGKPDPKSNADSTPRARPTSTR